MNTLSRHRRPTQQGFTLIELLVAAAIGLLLLGGVAVVFISSQNAAREARDVSRLQENLRFASDFLVRDVRNAGFRDEANLLRSEWVTIGNEYVTFPDDSVFAISYAGRGSCDEQFNEITIVRNRYRVENGVLLCNETPLVSGVTGLAVTPIYPDSLLAGDEECGNIDPEVPNNCIGLNLAFTLEGGARGPTVVELKSIFRNQVLERLYPE